MGKHFVVIFFASALLGAVVVFLQRGERPARAKASEETPHDTHARIVLEDFVVYQYKNHLATETFQGKHAEFVDPDMLEVFGDVLGTRLQSSKKEFVAADSLRVHFESKGLTELVKNSKVLSSEFENDVRVGYDDNVLYTDYAKYVHADEKLISDRPVRIQAPRAELKGSRGFEYETKSQNLKIFGPMEGTLVDVQTKSKTKTKR